MSALGGAPAGAPPPRSCEGGVRLAPHVRWAHAGRHTIVLDLERNRYLALQRRDFEAALGAPSPKSPLCAGLARAGLLALPGDSMQSRRRRRWMLGGAGPGGFIAACCWAQAIVATGRLERAVAEIEACKRACASPRIGADALGARFSAWRPWYPKRRICLFDSLALIRFVLAGSGCADLVIGVRAMPFAAHCWVEAAGVPLNDEAFYCAAFTPILRV